jgi:hypothetical protein
MNESPVRIFTVSLADIRPRRVNASTRLGHAVTRSRRVTGELAIIPSQLRLDVLLLGISATPVLAEKTPFTCLNGLNKTVIRLCTYLPGTVFQFFQSGRCSSVLSPKKPQRPGAVTITANATVTLHSSWTAEMHTHKATAWPNIAHILCVRRQ